MLKPPSRALALLFAILAALCSAGRPAIAQCSPGWSRADSTSGGGPFGDVYALALAPNGDIIAGGAFTTVGPSSQENRIARWNGSVWSALGSGMNNTVVAVAALPNGDVVASGFFTTAGGVAANNIARWNGTAWAPMGPGPGFAPRALLAMPNGDVVAGGAGVARWNGSAWATLAGLADVNDLAVDSAGGIIAVGSFNGGVSRWDGAAWTVIGGGVMRQSFPFVNSVVVQTNGAIVVAGGFNSAGGVPVSNIARWNGIAWDALAGGTPNTVNKILYTGGFNFTAYTDGPTMRWDGSAWQTTPTANDVPGVRAAVLGPQSVTVGGLFPLQVGLGPTSIGLSSGVAQTFSTGWKAPGTGTSNGSAGPLLALPQGGVIVAGSFTGVSGVAANGIAKWDGAVWSPLGLGIQGVNALAAMPNGDVIVGGGFTIAGGVSANRIARWNGSAWTPLGTGITASGLPGPSVNSLAVMPNGDVIAGGRFNIAGGVSANRIARWNGTAWAPLGTGIPGTPLSISVKALAVMPNGDLIAGGRFTNAGGVSDVNNIARWDGTAWAPLGSGMDGDVNLLVVMPNGDLIAAGPFSEAGGVSAENIARWDGSAWSAMSTSLSNASISSLVVSPEGELFACGSISAFDHIARWTGSEWVATFAFGAGTSANFINGLAFLAPAPGVRSILVGGGFTSAGYQAVSGVAQYLETGRGWIVSPPQPASAPVRGSARFDATLSIPFCDYPAQWRLNGAPLGLSGTTTPNGSVFSANPSAPTLIASNLSPLDAGALTLATASGIVSAPVRLTVGRSACPGDANADGAVDFFDLALLLAFYGTTAPAPGENGDVNGDGVIDFFDLNILLANYGRAC